MVTTAWPGAFGGRPPLDGPPLLGELGRDLTAWVDQTPGVSYMAASRVAEIIPAIGGRVRRLGASRVVAMIMAACGPSCEKWGGLRTEPKPQQWVGCAAHWRRCFLPDDCYLPDGSLVTEHNDDLPF